MCLFPDYLFFYAVFTWAAKWTRWNPWILSVTPEEQFGTKRVFCSTYFHIFSLFFHLPAQWNNSSHLNVSPGASTDWMEDPFAPDFIAACNYLQRALRRSSRCNNCGLSFYHVKKNMLLLCAICSANSLFCHWFILRACNKWRGRIILFFFGMGSEGANWLAF